MGIVFDIQKFCIYDGPGIRTTVFLKGCNIRCQWCHNPESFAAKPQLSFDKDKCVGCGDCARVCEQGVHSFKNGLHKVDFSKCIACGKCVDACVFQALKIFGKEMTADQVLAEVMKDKKYYKDDGGVTISGGEPSFQFEFLMELLRKFKEAGLHICLETNGIMSSEKIRMISQYVDLFLLDYKATGFELHKKLTGASNEQMLKNLNLLESLDKPVVLRCPVIPGLNDQDEHFEKIKELKKQHKNIRKVEIMAYHSLGKCKWDSLGFDYSLAYLDDVSKEQKKEWETSVNS